MATSVNVNVRTTKLNQPNTFTITYDQRTLFTFRLSDEKIQVALDWVMRFASDIFEDQNPE